MSRATDHPVEALFVDRWSPRSFTGEPVPDTVLKSAFEAARWAPSALNAQPWRFLVTRPGDPWWENYLAFLMPRNRLWAAHASALVLILSSRFADRRGEIVENTSHSFDAGAAWANFAHQALLLGWYTHGIGGFDKNAARARLAIPDNFAIEAIIALGRKGDLDRLDPEFHGAEVPNGRRPLADTVFAGSLNEPAFSNGKDAA